MPLLSVDNVSKMFGGLVAIRNLSFGVERGEIVGMIGPNGAGKTTTFEVISGFPPATEGRVVFKDADLRGRRPYETARLGLGRTFQITQPFPRFTVLENVMVAAFMNNPGRSVAEAKARRILSRGMAAKAGCSRASRSAVSRWRVRCQAASSRCSRSAAGSCRSRRS
jgi:branched-chain amino acid transport system ATP-binding protein